MTKPPTPADTVTREEAKDARGKRAFSDSETTGIVVGVDDGCAPVLLPPERRLLLRYADQEGDRYDYPRSRGSRALEVGNRHRDLQVTMMPCLRVRRLNGVSCAKTSSLQADFGLQLPGSQQCLHLLTSCLPSMSSPEQAVIPEKHLPGGYTRILGGGFVPAQGQICMPHGDVKEHTQTSSS